MNNKTYTILQSFDKYEVNRLRKFLQSPYFNMNEAIVALFEVFIKDIFGKKTKELEKEIIWEKIYGQKKYDDVRFRKLNSELLKLVEKFLAQQTYEANPIYQANYLIESVGNRKLKKLYGSTMKTARRLSNQQKFRPASFYFYQYEIEKNYYQLTNLDMKRGEKGNEDIISKNLDVFYFSEKLKLYSSALSRTLVASHDYDIAFIDEIVSHIKEHDYESIPTIAIYYRIVLTYIENDNEENYFELKKLLEKHSSIFPIDEAYIIYQIVMNYCIGKANKKGQNFLNEFFELYRILLKNEIFVNGEISPWDFKNVILASLRLGEYEWTENFIKKYSSKLAESFRDNAVTFNSAQLYFYQKKYDDVIRLLNQVEYEDLAYNLNSKLMLIAVYYETDEIEPLYSLFESFRVYLNRSKKIPQSRKKFYLNFIKLTKKLTRIMPGDNVAISKIHNEISNTRDIVNLKWLKEKIAELE